MTWIPQPHKFTQTQIDTVAADVVKIKITIPFHEAQRVATGALAAALPVVREIVLAEMAAERKRGAV